MHCVHTGLLSLVGDMTSTEVDHCTLHYTWTAPYTLQGVPINYYTINITRHSDGAVLRSDTTNTTEYLYSVSSLGETLEVVVAAVNGVGTGNATSIVTQSLSLSELMTCDNYFCYNYIVSGIKLISIVQKAKRNDINWSYTFVFKVTLEHVSFAFIFYLFCRIIWCVKMPSVILQLKHV